MTVQDRLDASSRIEELLGQIRDGISESEAGAERLGRVGPVLEEVLRLDDQCVEAWELKVQLLREAKAWESLGAALAALADQLSGRLIKGDGHRRRAVMTEFFIDAFELTEPNSIALIVLGEGAH